jgi:hypothetical protein
MSTVRQGANSTERLTLSPELKAVTGRVPQELLDELGVYSLGQKQPWQCTWGEV